MNFISKLIHDDIYNNLKRIFEFLTYTLSYALRKITFILIKVLLYLNVSFFSFYHFIISKSGLFKDKSIDLYVFEKINSDSACGENCLHIAKYLLENNLNLFKINNNLNSIGILISDKNYLYEVFKILKKDNSLWVEFDSKYGLFSSRLCCIPDFLISRLLVANNQINFFRRYLSKNNRVIFGSESGCNLEIWLNSEAHYKLREEYKRKVYKIASLEWLESKKLLLNEKNLNSFKFTSYNTDFPIDIVYTWVDNNDPKWLKSYNKTLNEFKDSEFLGTSTIESRFRNLNELKYSIRSLCMYGNFFRKIYIVTAGQIPDWLNTENNKVEIIDHKEIFDNKNDLPTFNSHAIESRLHHIEGLSEHYLYFNDDVFIGRPAKPEIFFSNHHYTNYFYSKNTYIGLNPPNPLDLPVDAAAKNNRDLIHSKFGCIVTEKFLHAPHPQLKSVLFEVEQDFKEILRKTAKNKFRSKDDISLPSSLYHHYAKLNNKAISGFINYKYIDLSHNNALGLLNDLLNLNNLNRPDVFCINDVDFDSGNKLEFLEKLNNFFESYFPVKSEFEK